MKMRPCYKSRLFRLGVPGLVFLLWVWWDSGRYMSAVSWDGSNGNQRLLVHRGEVEWRRIRDNSFGSVGAGFAMKRDPEWEFDENGVLRELNRQFDLPKALMWAPDVYELGRLRREILDVSVALWVVVLGYGMMWLGAVIAWERRQARERRCLTEMEREKEVGS